MRARPLAWQLPVFVALAGVWAAAAYFLWESKVPSSLSLPNLDPHAFYTQHVLSRTADFENLLELSWVGEQIALVAVFVAYARWGARFMRESAAGPITTATRRPSGLTCGSRKRRGAPPMRVMRPPSSSQARWCSRKLGTPRP